jgi:hypothetical protein
MRAARYADSNVETIGASGMMQHHFDTLATATLPRGDTCHPMGGMQSVLAPFQIRTATPRGLRV